MNVGATLTLTTRRGARPIVSSSLAMKRRVLELSLHDCETRLPEFERQSRRTSGGLVERLKSGELGDDAEWFEWQFVMLTHLPLLDKGKGKQTFSALRAFVSTSRSARPKALPCHPEHFHSPESYRLAKRPPYSHQTRTHPPHPLLASASTPLLLHPRALLTHSSRSLRSCRLAKRLPISHPR